MCVYVCVCVVERRRRWDEVLVAVIGSEIDRKVTCMYVCVCVCVGERRRRWDDVTV